MNIQLGITDHLDPEVQAMLMAMYSRSYAPIASRIPSNAESTQDHKEKLGKYYRDWGHKSVGQLGSTTIWFEGVSQLAAKAIENHKLFNGQESSTRYIDFSTQPFVVPAGISVDWSEKFRNFYISTMPKVISHLENKFPFNEQQSIGYESEASIAKARIVWTNTIKARAFDIMRGFLPAGATTNVAFVGTFDTINDHFGEMLMHPLTEMQEIATEALTQLAAKYQYAAINIDKLKARNSYLSKDHFYQRSFGMPGVLDQVTGMVYSNLEEIFKSRLPYQKLPKLGFKFNYTDLIDFGSYRDLHRHRNGDINMPILNPAHGFNSYYLTSLPPEIHQEAFDLLDEFETWYDLTVNDVDWLQLQYMVPMGYNVKFEYFCDLNQLLYILELRSQKTVHQTLREVVLRWYKELKGMHPSINIGVDQSVDNFTLKRGMQTVSETR